MPFRKLALLALLALCASLLGARCFPHWPTILLPARESHHAGPEVQVVIQLPEPLALASTVRVLLMRSLDEPPITQVDVGGFLDVSPSGSLTGTLSAPQLVPGRNRLVVLLDKDGDGVVEGAANAFFSWEPQIDSANAVDCDPFDTTRCLLPFPNDHFTREDAGTPTGRRVDFALASMPSNFGGVRADPARWNLLDGFAVGPALLTDIPAVDLAATGAPPLTDIARSLDPDSPVVLIDAESGERQLHWVERDTSDPSGAQRPILVRVGRNLANGRRYVVAFRRLRDAGGALLEAPRAFRIYRDGLPTYDPALEARRPHMEDVFARLAAAGITREELYLAWDFTTQSVESAAGKMLHMRDDAFERVLAGAAPSFTVTSVEEPLDSNVWRRVQGTFQSPLYMTGGGAPGELLRLGPDGLPVNEGDFFTARFRCVIPWSATTDGAGPAAPARPSLYGHGLLGSERETSAGNVRVMANSHNMIFCGTRWTGMEEDDFPTAIDILSEFGQFPKFSERLHQGLLNFLVLGRLMIHPDGLASDPAFQVEGESLVDRSELFYDGNSQGAIAGGALAAFAQDFTRAVLGVPGMNYSTLLRRSIDFDDFNLIFNISYQENFDRTLLINMAQMLWEQAEVSGHVNHITGDTYPNTPPKKILLHMAFADHQTANVSVEVEARSLGAHIHTPALVPGKAVPDVTPYYGIPPIPSYPFDGSALIVWDSGNPAPPVANTAPRLSPADPEWADLSACAQRFGGDPHECPRRQPSAQLQKSEFLKTGGAVVDVCGGEACLAPILP